MRKAVTIVVFIFVGISGLLAFRLLVNNNEDVANQDGSSQVVKLISAREFDELASDPGAFIVDVHIPEQTHIPGTTAFIPYNQIQQHTDQLPGDKDTPILVYCRSGSMSQQASQELVSLGYRNVYDLEGGIRAYQESHSKVSIDPPTRDLGTVSYGEVPTTNFTLTNFTPVSMAVTRVSTSCSCTSAEVKKTELEPYDSTAVDVSFDPAVHQDDTDLGDITRTIYLETDNPNFPKLTAEITAVVEKK
jgi:rhodanese-related sulfurtransferase